jgi:hypothetical protein
MWNVYESGTRSRNSKIPEIALLGETLNVTDHESDLTSDMRFER